MRFLKVPSRPKRSKSMQNPIPNFIKKTKKATPSREWPLALQLFNLRYGQDEALTK